MTMNSLLGILFVLVVTVMEARSLGYGDMMVAKKEPEPDDRCKKVGQYLLIPGEKCKFLVCDYGNEPWKDSYGDVKLFTTEMPCAPGTFVGDSSTHGYGIINPCNGRHPKMCLPKKKKTTGYGKPMSKPTGYSSGGSKKKTMKEVVAKQKEEVATMGYEEVTETMMKLAHMMQSQMYTVMEIKPKSRSKQRKMKSMKYKMEEMASKAESAGYGSRDMSLSEMKTMCYKMMDTMIEAAKMKAEAKHDGYGNPMMMVMPMGGYGSMIEEEEEPQGYGMPKMRKMKKIVKMMMKVMKMMDQGYGSSMSTSGYGQMEESEPAGYGDDSMSTGYGTMAQSKPMPSGYGSMDNSKPVVSGYGTMDSKPVVSGYGNMEESKPMPSGYDSMEASKPTSSGYGTMGSKPMVSGYGDMQQSKPTMSGYGSMEDSKPMVSGYGDSKPMMSGYGDSKPMMSGYGDSKPMMSGYGDSKPMMSGYGMESKPMTSGYGKMEEMMSGGYGMMDSMKPMKAMAGYGQMMQKMSEMMSGYGQMSEMKQTSSGYGQNPIMIIMMPTERKQMSNKGYWD